MKKMQKKIIAIALAAVCGSTAMSGCGSKKVSTDDKITLNLWLKPGQDAAEYVMESGTRMMSALEEKFPEINFVFSEPPSAGTDYRQEYDKALMAGTAPAFYTQFSYTDIPSRIDNGTVADITKYVENWELKKEDKILTTFDEAISKNGKWYALPHSAYNMGTMVCKKTVEAAGGDSENLPSTWEEFAAFGEKATDFDIPRIGYSLMGMDWCAWPFTAWVWSAGGEMVRRNEDGTYKVAFNEDAGVDAAVFLNEMIWKYKMTQKDVLEGMGDINSKVLNGTACFAWLDMANLNTEQLSEYDLKVSDFTQIPMPVKDASIPRPSLAGGEVISFNPKLTEAELDAAVEVAQWLYFSDERMQALCDEIVEFNLTDLKIPGRVDWYEKKLATNTSITDEQIQDMVLMEENAKPEPYCPHWSEIKSELVAPLQKIYLSEGITRDEVKNLLDECADKIYSTYSETFVK